MSPDDAVAQAQLNVERTAIQFTDGTEHFFDTEFDKTHGVYLLKNAENPNSTGELSCAEAGGGKLSFEGQFDGHRVRASLHQTPVTTRLLEEKFRFTPGP